MQTSKKHPPSCSFSLQDLLELIKKCLKLHVECQEQFIDDISTGKFLVESIPPGNSVNAKNFVTENLWWAVHFWGDNGEFLHIANFNEFSDADFPNKISKIKIENLSRYEFRNRELKPSISFSVTIDFGTNRVLDLASSPTLRTANASSIEVSGINSVLVLGLTAKFEEFFQQHRNLNHLIHAENVYDISLWIGFLPLAIFLIFKNQEHISERITSAPLLAQSMLAIVSLFQLIILFRIIFNTGRWFFPLQELSTNISLGKKVARYIYFVCIAGVLGTLAFNFICWLIQKAIQ